VTLGHNRKTHRTFDIQIVVIFKESYNFPKPMCPTVPYVVICIR
jgi:hypothetical protein